MLLGSQEAHGRGLSSRTITRFSHPRHPTRRSHRLQAFQAALFRREIWTTWCFAAPRFLCSTILNSRACAGTIEPATGPAELTTTTSYKNLQVEGAPFSGLECFPACTPMDGATHRSPRQIALQTQTPKYAMVQGRSTAARRQLTVGRYSPPWYATAPTPTIWPGHAWPTMPTTWRSPCSGISGGRRFLTTAT